MKKEVEKTLKNRKQVVEDDLEAKKRELIKELEKMEL